MPRADLLKELYELRDQTDELIELGLVRRWSVSETLGTLLPRVADRIGATGAFVETYGEDRELHLVAWGGEGGKPLVIPQKADVWTKTSDAGRARVTLEAAGTGGERVLVAQHLDVAGVWFGRAGLVAPKGADVERLAESLDAVCEVLDNFLFSIRAARDKHDVMMRLAKALRHRVLAEGLRQAVGVLASAIPLDRTVLVCLASGEAPHVQMFEGSELRVDTLTGPAEASAPLRRLGRDYLRGDASALLDHLGVENAQEEVLINGITKSVVVGKVVVTSKIGGFNTYDRELLAAFAGYIRQRVVDWGKEWHALGASFRPEDVARLLEHDDYDKRFLAPRDETVAMMYVDLCGFTRISETLLRTPANVAALVETWGREAVDIVWRHGGVFDKMVGDCVIALFGPPFYDAPPEDRLARAIRCAIDIRAMTAELPKRPAFAALLEGGLGVTAGVNLAPLFVGSFGPNENFTGFSSGMNNTARLQHCAVHDEIVVMEDAIAKLPDGHGFAFGEPRSATVKNVADPLRFRPLA